ncbi:MAG TPA: M56 family metallopeptidase, partial [Longimicrobium sp.]|nr:M56 family metallopeptidase [Longimicrobium sp.]
RSRIVLPEWVVRDAEPGVRALLLEHEREHLRAGDPRLLALGLGAVALMPWNPAAWWQLRRLRLAVEMDCDARVLARRADVRTYGALLLEVGRRASGDRMITAAAFSEPASFLERRIRMMTLPRARRPLPRALAFGGMAALLVAAACRAPGPARPTPTDPPAPPQTTAAAGVADAPVAPAATARTETAIAPAVTVSGSGQTAVAPAPTVAGSAQAAVAPGTTVGTPVRATAAPATTVAGSGRAAVAPAPAIVGSAQGTVAPVAAPAPSVEAGVATGPAAARPVKGAVAPAAGSARTIEGAAVPVVSPEARPPRREERP